MFLEKKIFQWIFFFFLIFTFFTPLQGGEYVERIVQTHSDEVPVVQHWSLLKTIVPRLHLFGGDVDHISHLHAHPDVKLVSDNKRLSRFTRPGLELD